MYYILATSLIVLSLFEGFFKDFRLKDVFFFLAAALFIVIQGYNTWSPDMESYELHYTYIHKDYVRNAMEPLHIFLIQRSQAFGLNFQEFILLYGLLIMLPFLYFVKRVSPLPVFVLSIFFFIPFFPDITQLRNFFSFALFFMAVYYFGRNKVVFLAFLVLSLISHYSMLAMILFFIVRRLKIFNDYRKSNIIILFGMTLLTLVPKQISDPLITAINPKYSSYLEATSTYLGTIALFLPFFLLNNFVLYHFKNIYPRLERKISEQYRANIPLFIQLIQFGNYLILLQYFIRDFSRLTMNLSILSYIYLSILLFYGWSHKFYRLRLHMLRFGTLVWGITAFMVVFLLLNQGEYMKIIEKTFSSNRIYGE
ncbi:EpsG family protein [Cloacibacterium normanense]|uniref:EpsG family protein n=1 Tax=Cloacibacterium normanense TaxID=237258 RepID=UPI0035B11989